MFWLGHESFSILSDVFCQKVSFPAKTAVITFFFKDSKFYIHVLRIQSFRFYIIG